MRCIDQIGNALELNTVPRRVISLVPSQSELLWDLGLGQQLVGITKFCVHPNEMFRSVERVGGTKELNLEKIRQLKPDLIIGNKEENERSQIEILSKEFNVWMSDIYNFEDALNMVSSLGTILGREQIAGELREKISRALMAVRNTFKGQTVAYFIWNKPYMLAAADTFIDCALRRIGLNNVAHGLSRYPELDLAGLKKLDPQFCFLSSEPFPFSEKHVRELSEHLPNSRITLVDGEMFSWYGSRLIKLPGYIEQLQAQLQL
jgi:ABC-type Fe3+-hydroxamate transport system substrate-binding protein